MSAEEEEKTKPVPAKKPMVKKPVAKKEATPKKPTPGAASTRARAVAGETPALDAPVDETLPSDEVPGVTKPTRVGRKTPLKRKVEVGAMPRLKARYRTEIKEQLLKDFGYSSVMQVPEVTKVIVNIGLGEALTNGKALETAPEQIGIITGQKPVITKARKSVAQFKVREGQSIGVMVTMRGRRMYDFLDRMISMALPRIRDFRGVSRTAFDGNGNYSLGLREQIMFPEIDYGSIDRIRGMQINITTSAKTDPEGFRLLELMGLPFAREGQTR